MTAIWVAMAARRRRMAAMRMMKRRKKKKETAFTNIATVEVCFDADDLEEASVTEALESIDFFDKIDILSSFNECGRVFRDYINGELRCDLNLYVKLELTAVKDYILSEGDLYSELNKVKGCLANTLTVKKIKTFQHDGTEDK